MSRNKQFDERRMLRIDGEKPTVRDRWTAFYRLWRMLEHCHQGPMGGNELAKDCLRVLMPGLPLWLVSDREGSVLGSDRRHWPAFLRRRFVAMERRKRLHGDRCQWLELDQRVAALMREQGVEYTPEQAAEARIEVTAKMRKHAAENGIDVPANDEEFFHWVRRVLNGKDDAT